MGGGGKQDSRNRLRKQELQRFAEEIGKLHQFAIFLQGQANGIRSSIKCLHISLNIGVADL